MAKYVCPICGYTYDEALGRPEDGIAPGTIWQDVPEDWVCPLCGASKSVFEGQATPEPKAVPAASTMQAQEEPLRELSVGELAALCTNLAKGCEKQYRAQEAELFSQLAAYYESRIPMSEPKDFSQLLALIEQELKSDYPAAKDTAAANQDRGSLRALTWGEKVSRILVSLLGKFEKQGDAMLDGTNVYVCDICGFVYIGNEPPEICPVCKVPSLKISMIAKEAV
ncbi:MAG: rubredoxin [Clostridiales bacterium]|nr:rubredoxin [Clostridiales bacterium]